MFQKEHRSELLKHFGHNVCYDTFKNLLLFEQSVSVLSETNFTFFRARRFTTFKPLAIVA